MGENPADRADICDEGEEPAGSAAGIAQQDVDEEHSAEQLGPRVALAFWLGWLAVRVRLRGWARGARRDRGSVVGRRRHDAVAERRGGCEQTVVGDEADEWPWHERGQALDEGERVHDDVREAVAEGALEPVQDLAIGGERQTIVDDWRSGGVAAELLQPCGGAGGHAHGSVQREAIARGAERSAVELARLVSPG